MSDMVELGPGPSTAPDMIPEPTTTELDKKCCICMRKNRKLLHLCLVNGGGSLFSLLCDDQDDSPDGSKEPTRLIICWECDAIMSKVVRFRKQACKAQERLSAMVEGRTIVQHLLPPTFGARSPDLEDFFLEYYPQGRADPSQPMLRIVRYVLPDGTLTSSAVPRDSSSTGQRSA